MPLNKASDSRIHIGFTGDVMIGRLVEETLCTEEPSYIWGNTLPQLLSTDVKLINLEAALTTSKKKVFKTFNFKASPKRVAALKAASVDVANLANNHSLDYSIEGLLETLQVLDKVQILHVGAGKNLEEAKQAVIIDVKGVKIGIIGCTDNEPSWKAKSQSPGINYIEIDKTGQACIAKEVATLKKSVDIVILSVHWGPNMRERPPANFQRFARSAIDSGVDIFHGHSAHIFQGVEIYKKKVIFYDTGDFIDDYYTDPKLRNDRSFFFKVEATSSQILSITLIPTLISNCQVNLSVGEEKSKTTERMLMLSKEMGTRFLKTDLGLTAQVG